MRTESTQSTPLVRRIFLGKPFIIAVAMVIIYTLAGFFLAPYLINRHLNSFVSHDLGRRLSIEKVRVNPYALTLEISGAALTEADGSQIFSFQRFFTNFELSSLFRWAWTFSDISIERPSLNVEIQRNGRLNLADLAEKLPKSKGPPTSDHHPPRLLLQHAAVVDGSFTFSDSSNPTPATAAFTPINLEFNKISTLPERKGPYTIMANLPGGGKVGWRGEISLQPVFSEGELTITGFKPATVWKFVQDKLHLAKPSGEIDFSTRYRFDYKDHTPFLVSQDTKLAIKGLVLTEKGRNTPMLDLATIAVDGMQFDLQAQKLTVSSISVRNGKIAALMDEEGLLDWQKFIAHRKPESVSTGIPDGAISVGKPWHLKVKTAQVENVALDYEDRSRLVPLAITIDGLNILLNAAAEVGTGPIKAIVDGLKVKLDRVKLSEAGDNIPLLALDTLGLEDGRIDIDSRSVMVKRIKAAGGKTSVLRSKNGRIRLTEIISSRDRGMLKHGNEKADMKDRSDGKPWSLKIDAIELNGYSVALQDRAFTPAIVYDFQDIRALVKNITNDGETPIDFDAKLKVVQGGNVSVSGQISQVGDHASARAKIIGINLKPLHPVVTKFTSLSLDSGNVSASGHLSYRSAKTGPQLSVDGSVNVDRLRLNEADTGKRFLEWKQMSANGLKFGLAPRRLQIKKVKLLAPETKVLIFKDRSVNLAKVLKETDTDDAKTVPSSSQAHAVVGGKNQTLFPVNIDRVHVEKGVVDFADLSLVLPFAARVTEFNGSVTNISSAPSSLASLKFDGRVDQYGLAKVDGRLSPFMPKSFTDITVLFRNVQMKPYSPYSATFAGRKIASGKLSLTLEYKVKNSQLLGDNKVLLEAFTLGDRVEAPNAINLPLDLAIALLTDSEGKIDMAVPVHGNLDDPEFSYGHVIWKAFVNLITKIVTAPFRALGGLLGGGSEQVSAIAFDPGSVRLLPPEQEKLKKVAEALEKRPHLKLVVQGRFDPEIDAKALRTERVRRDLALEMNMKLAPDEKMGLIAFNNAKVQKALEKLLERRGGDKAFADFKMRYEKATGKKAKRVNFALAIIGRGSSDTAFYQAMFKELIEMAPIMDNDLQDLAQRRAEAIVNELNTTAGLDVTRVTAGSAGPVEKPSTKTVKTRLKLDVVKPKT